MSVRSTYPSQPPRPALWQERLANRLFLAFSPRVPATGVPSPPASLSPFEDVAIHRGGGAGTLSATWYAAPGKARGAVLLLHPWTARGRSYFHRHGRIEALRAAGYHAMAIDFAGFGASGGPAGFFDRDVDDALAFLARRAAGLPLLVWGVSAGGFWAHPALGRTHAVAGAVFEDVSPHLFEWSWRKLPRWRLGYLFFRAVFPRCYRYLDIRLHAAALAGRPLAYVSGALDCGVRPEDTEALAAASRAPFRIIPGAGHLASIKVARSDVLEWALATLDGAVAGDAAGEEAVSVAQAR